MKILTLVLAFAASACVAGTTLPAPVGPTPPPSTDVGSPAPVVMSAGALVSGNGGTGCLRIRTPCHP
jgi:hypothetical protein